MTKYLFCRLIKISTFLFMAMFLNKVEAQSLVPVAEVKTETVAKAENVVKSETPKVTDEKPVVKKDEKPSNIKVTFDETNPNIMIIEANGEKIRVDASKKTIEQIVELQKAVAENEKSDATVSSDAVATSAKKDEPKEDLYAYDEDEEPFVYKVINVPTPKKVPKGTWNLNFSHRFSQPIRPFKESGRGLLGFDSFSASSFGIMYGITDKFYVNASRSPVCQRGMCRTVEIGFGYHVTDQNKKSPVAFSVYASAEGNENFSQEYTYNFQAMVSRDIGKRLFLFFSPAFHLNSNGQHRFNPRPEEFFPPSVAAANFKLPANSASFGFGAQFRIKPNVSLLAEFTPRTGFKHGRVDPIFDTNFNVVGFNSVSQPAIGFGVQYSIGKHAFAFTLSNTQTTTTSKYNSSNLVLSPKNLTVGFNLFRRW